MVPDIKSRIIWLLVAALLVGAAVLTRVWLAATGSYSQETLAVMLLRVASAACLISGLVLAGAIVAWPVPRPTRPPIGDGEPESGDSPRGKA